MTKVRTVILIFITILACFVIETTVLPSIAVQDIMPNLMIIVTASYGFMFGDRSGILVGFFCGFLCDLFFGPLIGIQAGVYALIGFLSGKFQKILYVEDLTFPLVLIAGCDLIYGLLMFVFLFLIQNRLFFREFFFTCIVPEIVYTVLAAVIVYPILRFLYNHFMRPRHQTGQNAKSL